jgi:hypothetical protein
MESASERGKLLGGESRDLPAGKLAHGLGVTGFRSSPTLPRSKKESGPGSLARFRFAVRHHLFSIFRFGDFADE